MHFFSIKNKIDTFYKFASGFDVKLNSYCEKLANDCAIHFRDNPGSRKLKFKFDFIDFVNEDLGEYKTDYFVYVLIVSFLPEEFKKHPSKDAALKGAAGKDQDGGPGDYVINLINVSFDDEQDFINIKSVITHELIHIYQMIRKQYVFGEDIINGYLMSPHLDKFWEIVFKQNKTKIDKEFVIKFFIKNYDEMLNGEINVNKALYKSLIKKALNEANNKNYNELELLLKEIYGTINFKKSQIKTESIKEQINKLIYYTENVLGSGISEEAEDVLSELLTLEPGKSLSEVRNPYKKEYLLELNQAREALKNKDYSSLLDHLYHINGFLYNNSPDEQEAMIQQIVILFRAYINNFLKQNNSISITKSNILKSFLKQKGIHKYIENKFVYKNKLRLFKALSYILDSEFSGTFSS